MLRTRRSFGRVLGLGAFLPPVLRGQSQTQTQPRKRAGALAEEKKPRIDLRVDTNLGLVPVTVCDPLNRPVTGLEKEHFRVYEDKVEQAITHFSMDDEPVAVGRSEERR